MTLIVITLFSILVSNKIWFCLGKRTFFFRPDTKGVGIPTFAELFPDKFVDPKVFRKAREASSVAPTGARVRK